MDIYAILASIFAAICSLVTLVKQWKDSSLSKNLEDTNHKLYSTNKELYRVYLNVNELLQIEKDLLEELDMSKKSARQGYHTDKYIQPKHVMTRIKELEQELQVNSSLI